MSSLGYECAYYWRWRSILLSNCIIPNWNVNEENVYHKILSSDTHDWQYFSILLRQQWSVFWGRVRTSLKVKRYLPTTQVITLLSPGLSRNQIMAPNWLQYLYKAVVFYASNAPTINIYEHFWGEARRSFFHFGLEQRPKQFSYPSFISNVTSKSKAHVFWSYVTQLN